jgi:hypothetical protein
MKALMDYFKKEYGINNPGEVTWSHAVNSHEKLAKSLNNSDFMVIESDIRKSLQGVPVAAHPPDTESDLSFNELINEMSQSKQGLKLDFKDPEIVIPCLQRLNKASLRQPILLNADILQGNGANPPKFNAVEFLTFCKKNYPKGILSLGWTTTADPTLGYTQKNIDEMLQLCQGIEEVTFPVRACLLPNSWDNLKQLTEKEGYTLSVWNNEPVDRKLWQWIKVNTDLNKTFYDFIDENKEPLRFW